MAIPAFIRSTGKRRVAANNTASLQFATLPALGNTVVVRTAVSTPLGGVVSVADNQGHTYTSAVESPSVGIAKNVAGIWFTRVTVSSGTFVVTVSSSGLAASTYITIEASEYSGLASSPLDQTATNSGTSANPTSGTTAATSIANELVVPVVTAVNFVTYTWGVPATGYTERVLETDGLTWMPIEGAEKVVSSTGTQAATWTNGSVTWTACIATFKALDNPWYARAQQ